jgi:signal transduction histidine kinase
MIAKKCLSLLVWLILLQVSPAQQALTSVKAIRSLNAEERERHLPVKLDAVVTYYHPAWGVLFVHDGVDGICVGVSEAQRPASPFVLGTRIKVTGEVSAGEFLPVVLPASLELGGPSPLPQYQSVSFEELFTPDMDARPVEVQAIVKSTSFSDESLVVDLEVEGHMIRSIVPQNEPLKKLPWQLVERRVRVQGIAGTHFNDQRQMSGRLLYVQGLESFIIDAAEKPQDAAPLVPIEGLLRVGSPLRQKLRVSGVATHVISGRGLYLRGDGGSMFVQTAQPFSLAVGDEVEAEGYPVVTAFRPSLSATDVKKIGVKPRPEPIVFQASQTRHSREQCELIMLEAEFLESVPSRDGRSFICRVDGQIFEVLLAAPLLPAEPLIPGMKLRLTGICEFVTTRPLVIPRNATGFRLLLRSPEDILITARQPWWGEQRARWILGSLLVLAIAVGAWALTLQWVVRSQSDVIRQQAQQQATLEERQRIARDLHDTLEQELVGVTMLLDDTAKRIHGSQAPASQPLDLARRLLRRAREESRSTIRELRSVTLEKRGLPAALEELLRPMAVSGGAQFQVTIEGVAARLSGTLETHLLRVAQEAVANASHHAQAQHIETRLEYLKDRIKLTIQDDGCGFDPSSMTALAGHFGLSGMSERAAKIGGQLHIRSHPGAGTTVELSAPRIDFQGAS